MKIKEDTEAVKAIRIAYTELERRVKAMNYGDLEEMIAIENEATKLEQAYNRLEGHPVLAMIH